MTIIGIFYLLLIMGWIFLILVLKCKRARAKRLAEEQAAAAIAAQPCHVIQIGSNYYDIIPVTSSHNFSNYRSCANECNLQHQLANADNNNNITASSSSISAPPTAGLTSNTTRTHSRRASHLTHTNQAFIMDEGGIFPSPATCDLPPSYDDVMRLPTSYPKVAPSPFTPTYDEIMQSEYERNARNNLNNNSNGPAIIQVSSTTTENHENNQTRSENQELTTTIITNVTSNTNINHNVV